MKVFTSPLLWNALFAVAPTLATTYVQTDEIIGSDFYDAFNFEAIPDPTHGRVNYTDGPTARRLNLTFASDDTFILRTDAHTVLDPSGPGRNSVRIRTNKAYTEHVAVFDIRHLPQGCSTWPAVWETDEAIWPNGGEVDILEGVNDQGTNQVTLHTSPGCTMPASRPETGTPAQLDCDTTVNFSAGCGVKLVESTSYGPTFNSVGGGWFAVQRTDSFVNVWFWARNNPNVPIDVKVGTPAKSVTPDQWGTPSANFPNTSCDLASHFDGHNIIINLTLCGDFAGAVYGQSGCPSTCVDFVNNNPAAFVNAFFDFASIRVYEQS